MSRIDTEDQDQKLVRLHAQLSAAMLERGLRFARQDDPHLYRLAERSLLDPDARFELRVSVSQTGNVKTRGIVCDDGGELVEVFTITADTELPR